MVPFEWMKRGFMMSDADEEGRGKELPHSISNVENLPPDLVKRIRKFCSKNDFLE